MDDRQESADPKHIVIACHPEVRSFTMAVAETYCEAVEACGQRAVLRDLYRMGFDPVLKACERPGVADFAIAPDVAAELALLDDAAVIVLVYPIWFGTPPAMLKGYVERVLGSGVVPKAVEERSVRGALAGKRMVSFTTSASSEIWLDEQGQVNGLRSCFDRYIEHAFGMLPSKHIHFGHIVTGLDARFARQHLTDVRSEAKAIVDAIDHELPKKP